MVEIATPQNFLNKNRYRDKSLSVDERVQSLFEATKKNIKKLVGLELTLGEKILLRKIYCREEIENSTNSDNLGGFEEDIEITFRFINDIYGLNIPREDLEGKNRDYWNNLGDLFRSYQEKDHLPFLY